MRYVIYAIAIAEAITICYLTKEMSNRPHKTSTVVGSYEIGCNIGRHYADSNIFSCQKSANIFKSKLEDE